MAYIEDNDKLKDQQPGQDSGGGGAVGGIVGTSPTGGNGSASNTTGVGTGGTGNYTNIQSYLGANQGPGTSGLLQKTTDTAFSADKDKISSDVSKVKSTADEASKGLGQSDASKLIENASKSYSYGGNQSNDFSGNVFKVQDYLNSSYKGPTSYNTPAISSESQRYGTALGDDKSYRSLMGDIYNKNATDALTPGQYNLQNQFDSQDQKLVDARKNALQNYSGLQDFQKQQTGDVNNYLGQAQQKYGQDQNSLKDYLTGEANRAKANYDYTLGNAQNEKYGQAQGQLSDAQRAATLASGHVSDADKQSAMEWERQIGNPVPEQSPDARLAADIWGRDYAGKSGNAASPSLGWANANVSSKQAALDALKNQGLGNVDDQDKRYYNTIMGILGGNALAEKDY